MPDQSEYVELRLPISFEVSVNSSHLLDRDWLREFQIPVGRVGVAAEGRHLYGFLQFSGRLELMGRGDMSEDSVVPIFMAAHAPGRIAIEVFFANELYRRLGILFEIVWSDRRQYQKEPRAIRQLVGAALNMEQPWESDRASSNFVFEATHLRLGSASMSAILYYAGGIIAAAELIPLAKDIHDAYVETSAYTQQFIRVAMHLPDVEKYREHMRESYESEMTQQAKRGDFTKLQGLLQQLNYNPGPIDGRWGKLTQDAVAQFARNNHLPPGIKGTDDDFRRALSTAAAAQLQLPSGLS